VFCSPALAFSSSGILDLTLRQYPFYGHGASAASSTVENRANSGVLVLAASDCSDESRRVTRNRGKKATLIGKHAICVGFLARCGLGPRGTLGNELMQVVGVVRKDPFLR
jgi:hypothetical protein